VQVSSCLLSQIFFDPHAGEHQFSSEPASEWELAPVQEIPRATQLLRGLGNVQEFIRERWCRGRWGETQSRNLPRFLKTAEKMRQLPGF
jgi:hypothetical protein